MVNPRQIILFWIRQFSKAFYTTEKSCWFLDQCLCGCQFSQCKIKALEHMVCFRILQSIYCLDVQSLLFYGAAVVFPKVELFRHEYLFQNRFLLDFAWWRNMGYVELAGSSMSFSVISSVIAEQLKIAYTKWLLMNIHMRNCLCWSGHCKAGCQYVKPESNGLVLIYEARKQ